MADQNELGYSHEALIEEIEEAYQSGHLHGYTDEEIVYDVTLYHSQIEGVQEGSPAHAELSLVVKEWRKRFGHVAQ